MKGIVSLLNKSRADNKVHLRIVDTKRAKYATNGDTVTIIGKFKYYPGVRFFYHKINGYDFYFPVRMWEEYTGVLRVTMLYRMRTGRSMDEVLGFAKIKRKPRSD